MLEIRGEIVALMWLASVEGSNVMLRLGTAVGGSRRVRCSDLVSWPRESVLAI